MTQKTHKHTYALTLSYRGEGYCGFARQKNDFTVQEDLENALQTIFKTYVETTCAGRTDSGVHARGQVISFSLEEQVKSPLSLQKSINGLVQGKMSVIDAQEMPYKFSARFDAVSRVYKYYIASEVWPPVLAQDFSWHVPKNLDLDAMRAAATHLIGEHDFKSFCLAISSRDITTKRNVSLIELKEVKIFEEPLLEITVEGNAFLHNMVRCIVGSLVEVGKGMHEPIWIKQALEARDRKAAGCTAPAKGLIFWEVKY